MQAYEPYSSLVARYEALYRGCKPKGPGNGKGRSAGTWDATTLEALCERLQVLALDEYPALHVGTAPAPARHRAAQQGL